MNEEEIEELKDFTIDLTDIDELALGLEVCSKKSNMIIQEFADTIIQLQQENKQLQKELEEYKNPIKYFKYANKNVTEENKKYKEVLDKLQQENQSLKKENKILRENAENNDKVVDKVNWENQLLKKENQELKSQLKGTTHCFDEEEHEKLKKQLEEERNKVREYSYKLSNYRCEETYENQQKEFIEYMNKTIEELECHDIDDEEMKGYLIQRIDTFKEILNKYKEIIGISK